MPEKLNALLEKNFAPTLNRASNEVLDDLNNDKTLLAGLGKLAMQNDNLGIAVSAHKEIGSLEERAGGKQDSIMRQSHLDGTADADEKGSLRDVLKKAVTYSKPVDRLLFEEQNREQGGGKPVHDFRCAPREFKGQTARPE